MSERFFITEYALSSGIFEVEGRVEGDYVKTTRCARGLHVQGFRKPHWHTSLDDAVAQAMAMREQEIHTLLRRAERFAIKTIFKVNLLPARKRS
jgi:hypothetical protein